VSVIGASVPVAGATVSVIGASVPVAGATVSVIGASVPVRPGGEVRSWTRRSFGGGAREA
jgi:hypothetical protein